MKPKKPAPKKAQSAKAKKLSGHALEWSEKAAASLVERLCEQERVCSWAEISVVELVRLAKDEPFQFGRADSPVLLALLGIAGKAIRALNEIATQFPERVQPVSRDMIAWPAIISCKAATERQNKKLMDDIQLGAESIHRGQWQPKASTREAAQMYLWLRENKARLELPKLSRQTWEAWFEAGWQELLRITGGQPEKDEGLRAIGEHYGEHSKNNGVQAKATPATKEANIRHGIRKQLRQSFKGYVGGRWTD